MIKYAETSTVYVNGLSMKIMFKSGTKPLTVDAAGGLHTWHCLKPLGTHNNTPFLQYTLLETSHVGNSVIVRTDSQGW